MSARRRYYSGVVRAASQPPSAHSAAERRKNHERECKRRAACAGRTGPHGHVITRSVRDSDIPADYTFVLTRDEIYGSGGAAQTRGEAHAAE